MFPLLTCAATAFELSAFLIDNEEPEGAYHRLVTGVGIPAALSTLYRTLPTLTPKPGLILNIGIAGAYPGVGIDIGDIVIADGDVYGDVGMELPDAEPGFLPLGDTDFGREFYSAVLSTALPPEWAKVALPADAPYRVHIARGCTVNACAGTDATGERRRRIFSVGFETMEGAAVVQAGGEFGIPVCEVRAISNIAARRDMRPENIRRALDHLAHYLNACRNMRL